MKPDIAPSPEDAQRQARQWLLRLQDRDGEAWLAAFQAWLAADPQHARAYAEVDALWQASAAPAQRLAAEEGDALNAYLAQMGRPATRRAHGNHRRWSYPLASAACLLVMLWAGGCGRRATGSPTCPPTTSVRRARCGRSPWPTARA